MYKCGKKTNHPRKLHRVTRIQLLFSINYKQGINTGRVTRHTDSSSHSPSRIYTRRMILLDGWSVYSTNRANVSMRWYCCLAFILTVTWYVKVCVGPSYPDGVSPLPHLNSRYPFLDTWMERTMWEFLSVKQLNFLGQGSNSDSNSRAVQYVNHSHLKTRVLVLAWKIIKTTILYSSFGSEKVND